MSFQWMYSTSINVWKQHGLNLDAFALRRGVWCPRLSVPSQHYHSQPGSLLSPPLSKKVVCFLFVPMEILYIPSLQICLIHLCTEHWSCALCHQFNDITSSCVFFLMNRNADCLFKRKNGRCARCVCMFAATYVPQYFGCFSLIKL